MRHLLADPHLLEGGQGGQDGATNQHGVFVLRRSNDIDLHGSGSQRNAHSNKTPKNLFRLR